MHDLTFILHRLARRPGFAFFVVTTLAVGIGAATTIFSLVQAVLLRPPPYPQPDRMVVLSATTEDGLRQPLSYLDYRDYEQAMGTLGRLEVFDDGRNLPLTGGGLAENVRVTFVSEGFFELLGADVQVGRVLGPDDTWAPHAVLSHGFWTRRFGADRGVLGDAVQLGGNSFTVVGVLSADFDEFAPEAATDLFLPVTAAAGLFAPEYLDLREHRWLTGVGRLAPGRDLSAATREASAVARRLAEVHPQSNGGVGARLDPLREYAFGFRDLGRTTWILLGAVALILLIACVNVANLLLVQAAERRREVAVRQAVGASRLRILGQMLTEGLVISTLGGLLGAAIAFWGTWLLIARSPLPLPPFLDVGVDWRVLAACFALSLLVGLAVSVAPALRGLRLAALDDSLRAGARNVRGGKDFMHTLLVVGEVALAMLLLVGAGLFLRSFLAYADAGYGFTTDHVLTAHLRLPEDRYAGDDEVRAFHQRLVGGMSALPGVRSAHLWGPGRAGESEWFRDVIPEGADPERAEDRCRFFEHRITPGTLEALAIPLVRGRTLGVEDGPDAPKAALVSASLARACWGGEEAIGQRFRRAPFPDAPHFEVVGIVDDVLHRGRDPEQAVPHDAYYAMTQVPTKVLTLMLITEPRPEALIDPVRSRLREIDADLPLFDIASLEERRAEEANESRFYAVLMAVYAGAALLLAAMGIYSVLSYTVEQRRREMALRQALGACRRDLLRLVGGQMARKVGLGLAVGLVFALVGSRLLGGMLFRISASDPAAYLVTLLLFVVAGTIACVVPLRATLRADLVSALKDE